MSVSPPFSMPRCPTCGRPFEAGVLFCPDDGSRVVADVPAVPFPVPPYAVAPAPASQVLPAVVGVLVVTVVGLVGVLLWQQQTAARAMVRADRAEQDAADATRRAKEMPPAAPPLSPVVPPAQFTQTVYADSPRDGYLVLRQGPRAARGTEVLRIPHGAALELGECRPPGTSPGGRWGSWCRARYSGAEGWVFDAFLSR